MITFKIIEHEGELVMLLPDEAVARLKVGVGDEVLLMETPRGYELRSAKSIERDDTSP
jgi:hypothetical protein